MEKEHISTVLLLSVLLTFMCPVLGIIPLYHSIEAWKRIESQMFPMSSV